MCLFGKDIICQASLIDFEIGIKFRLRLLSIAHNIKMCDISPVIFVVIIYIRTVILEIIPPGD